MCTFPRRKFLESSGFSLVEVVVVTGISAVLALGSAGFIANIVKTGKAAETNAEVLSTKRLVESTIRDRKLSKTVLPIRFRNCFNPDVFENGTSVDNSGGAQLIFDTSTPDKPGLVIQQDQTLTMGANRFLVKDFSFDEARRIASDNTSIAYYGNIYMRTKNLTTNIESKRTLVSTVFLTVSPGASGGDCATISSINIDTIRTTGATTCVTIDGYSYDDFTDRCENDRIVITDPDPVSCMNNRGFPIFVHANGDEQRHEFFCVHPIKVVCLNRPTTDPNVSQNRVFRGFQFYDTGGGRRIGAPVCDIANIKAHVNAAQHYTPWVPPPPATNHASYTTPTRQTCNEMRAEDTNPNINCDAAATGTGQTETLAPDTSVAVPQLPTAAPNAPPTYSTMNSCDCGINPFTMVSTTVAHGEYCGIYFQGSFGYYENVVASSVYQCNNGSLSIVIENGTPAEVVPPPISSEPTAEELVERSGYSRPLRKGGCTLGRCTYQIP